MVRWPGQNLLRAGIARIAVASGVLLWALMGVGQTQRFQNPPLIATAVDPAGLIAGDWNGDGHQDLIYVEQSPTPFLHVLLGNGNGGFNEQTPVQLPPGTCSIYFLGGCKLTAGDFNGDGKQDLLMTGETSSGQLFLVLPGNGDGTFGVPVTSGYGGEFGDYADILYGAVADFDGNGTLDFAVPDYINGTIAIYTGDGTGHFFEKGSYSNANMPFVAFAADVNKDGNVDLLIGDLNPQGVGIWLGDGHGNFTEARVYSPATGCALDAVADMNGDGNVDLVCETASEPFKS